MALLAVLGTTAAGRPVEVVDRDCTYVPVGGAFFYEISVEFSGRGVGAVQFSLEEYDPEDGRSYFTGWTETETVRGRSSGPTTTVSKTFLTSEVGVSISDPANTSARINLVNGRTIVRNVLPDCVQAGG
jgi:hypothetical protein